MGSSEWLWCLGLYLFPDDADHPQRSNRAGQGGNVYCVGIATLLLFHLLVNVGMVVGRVPVTGIPLPLMSYGGSSLMSMFLMLGLVNNVRLRRFVN